MYSKSSLVIVAYRIHESKPKENSMILVVFTLLFVRVSFLLFLLYMQVLLHADAYLCLKQADYTSKLMFAVDIQVVSQNKSNVPSNNHLRN